MKNGIFLLLLSLAITSCTQNSTESLKAFVEYKTQSDDYIRWSRDQQITWDMFAGKPDGEGVNYTFFGLYFFYEDMAEDLKFNATVYFDKDKSWVKPKSEWGVDSVLYEQAQKVMKLQFDHYEVGARRLRKHLLENKDDFNDENALRRLGGEYYNAATEEWKIIQGALNYDYSDDKLAVIREALDSQLEELKDFDTRVNSVMD